LEEFIKGQTQNIAVMAETFFNEIEGKPDDFKYYQLWTSRSPFVFSATEPPPREILFKDLADYILKNYMHKLQLFYDNDGKFPPPLSVVKKLKPVLLPETHDEIALARLFFAAELTLWNKYELDNNFFTTVSAKTIHFLDEVPAELSGIDLKSWALKVLAVEKVKKVINKHVPVNVDPVSILKEVKIVDSGALRELVSFSTSDTIYINYTGLCDFGRLLPPTKIDKGDLQKIVKLHIATIVIYEFAEMASRVWSPDYLVKPHAITHMRVF